MYLASNVDAEPNGEPAGEHLAHLTARASFEHGARASEPQRANESAAAPTAGTNAQKTAELRETAAGDATATTDNEPQKRRPGRPKGVPNKVTRIGKEAIAEAAPHEFLIRVMQGRTFKRGEREGARRSVTIRPTLEQSIAAANILLRKMMPDVQSVALTGDGGGPVVVEHDPNDVVSSARWIAFALSRAKRLIEEENPSPIVTPAPAREPVDITHRQILRTGGSVPEADSPPPRFEEPIDLGGPVRIGSLEVLAMNGRHVVVRIEDGRALSFFSSRREAVAFAKARATGEIATSTASDPV